MQNSALTEDDFNLSPAKEPALLNDADFDLYNSGQQASSAPPMADHWYNPMLASLSGGVKGLGQTAESAGTLAGRIAAALTGQKNPFPQGNSLFDYSKGKNPLTQYLGSLESNYPEESRGASIAANAIPYLLAPEIGGAEVIGAKIAPGVGKFLTKNLIGRGISGAANMGALGAATAPIYNPDAPIGQSMLQGAKDNALVGGLAPLLLGVPLNAASRAASSLFGDAEKIAKQEGKAYDAIHGEAKANNFKADMSPYENKLNEYMEKFSNEPRGSVNEALENKVYGYADSLEKDIKDRPGVFDVKGVKALTRGINDEIGATKSKTEKTVLIDIKNSAKESLLKSLNEQGMSHLADKYLSTDKYYSQNVFPLRENPTSPRELMGQGAMTGVASLLPHSVGLPLLISLGMHGASNPAINLLRRYFGPYRGGVISDLLKNQHQPLLKTVNSASIPYYQGGRQ